MKPIVAGVLASVAALGLLTACGDDPIKTVPTNNSSPTGVTLPGGITLPDEVTLPEGITLPEDITVPEGATIPAGGLPSDASIPEALINQMIAQFEAAGLTVDKECFTNLLSDPALRNLVTNDQTPSPEVMQKFLACFKT